MSKKYRVSRIMVFQKLLGLLSLGMAWGYYKLASSGTTFDDREATPVIFFIIIGLAMLISNKKWLS